MHVFDHRHSEGMIEKLKSAGLGYFVTDTQFKLGMLTQTVVYVMIGSIIVSYVIVCHSNCMESYSGHITIVSEGINVF